MILTTQELDVIELLLEEQWESISSIQRTVLLNNECWWEYDYEWYFSDEDYRTWESLYESILLYYWNKFDDLMWDKYKCYINHWYYDYLYDELLRVEIQWLLDILTKKEIEELSEIPYVRYFLYMFNINYDN